MMSSKSFSLAEGSGDSIIAKDDVYSDRIRCDHPTVRSGERLADLLISAADRSGRGKILTLVDARHESALLRSGFLIAGRMEGFYQGLHDCSVMTFNMDPRRRQLANPKEVSRVNEALNKTHPLEKESLQKTIEQLDLSAPIAGPENAEEIAALIGQTFADYPTPSHDPAYIADCLSNGSVFRYVHESGKILACASADLVPSAKTAELTDCATLPRQRGRGLMKKILWDLMQDLRKMDYPTAFTLARARIPGINIIFKQLGFQYSGQISQSCRIGEGLEDINIWSRKLRP